jgi:transcriptional regulator with XRE-family HTH domain
MTNSIPNLQTATEIARLLGARCKALRLAAGLKRATLAERSGVSTRTLQRFENTGEVSLKNLLHLAHVHGRLTEFSDLFKPAPARTLAELDRGAAKPKPKRGRI